MSFTAQPERFRFAQALQAGVAGKRVLITGGGKDGGLGQGFALAAGLNGAASVAVHFHRSYPDGFDLVEALRKEGVNAFPVQADVTNLGARKKAIRWGVRCARSRGSRCRCGARAPVSTLSTIWKNRGSCSIPRS